jgi:uncharacterized phiE125 gp8 family phage protein
MLLAPYALPATAALTNTEIKTEVRQTASAEDSLLTFLASVVTRQVESYLRRSLINRTLVLHMDAFEVRPVIFLHRPPLVSITSAIATLKDDTTSTVDSGDYLVDTVGGRFILKSYNGAVFPSSMRPYDAFAITYVAGYGTASSSIPDNIREGLILAAADLYEQPQEKWETASLPKRAERVLFSSRNLRRS